MERVGSKNIGVHLCDLLEICIEFMAFINNELIPLLSFSALSQFL